MLNNLEKYKSCTICPHECKVNRLEGKKRKMQM